MPFGPGDFGRGYRPDGVAQRVLDVSVPTSFSASTPHDADLIAALGVPYPVKNQKKSNFCVRFARASACEIVAVLHGQAPLVSLSPLMAAWDDAMPGDQGRNVGTQIYLSAEAARTIGTCLEATYPFELTTNDDYLTRMKVRPPEYAYVEAERHQAVKSYRLPDGDFTAIIAALDNDCPVQIGTPIRPNFWNGLNADGVIDNKGTPIDGYHSMLVVGMKQIGSKWYFKLLNSWGVQPGDQGYVWWPLDQVSEWTDGRCYTEVEIV